MAKFKVTYMLEAVYEIEADSSDDAIELAEEMFEYKDVIKLGTVCIPELK